MKHKFRLTKNWLTVLVLLLTWPALSAHAAGPVISNLAIIANGPPAPIPPSTVLWNTITVYWTTDVPATSQVNYGIGQTNKQTALNPALVTTHEVTIPYLDSYVTYSYQANSTDGSGNKTSSSVQTILTCQAQPNYPATSGSINNYYEYGTYQIAWVNGSGIAQSPTICGQPFTQAYAGFLDRGSSFSLPLADTQEIVPSQSFWNIAVTGIDGSIGAFNIDFPATSTATNISTELSAAALGNLIHVWYDPATQVFYPPLTSGLALAGDANGQASANTVNGMHFGSTAFTLSITQPPSSSLPVLGYISPGVLGGIVGGSGCALGTCVINNGYATQNVVQAASTSLNDNSFESFYYADQYGDKSTNGIGTVTGLNTAVLPQNSTGPSGGTVYVSPIYPNTEFPQGYEMLSYGLRNFTWPSGATVYDFRNGVEQIASENPMSNVPEAGTPLSILTGITRSNLAQQPFPEASTPGAQSDILSVFAGGTNYHNYPAGSPSYFYKPYYETMQLKTDQWSSGQTYGIRNDINCYGVGDCFAEETQVQVDGGANTGDDEYQGIGDKSVTQNPRIYTGTITGTVTTGSTTIGTTATIGGGTEGQDRLLVDTASGHTITGNSFSGAYTALQPIGPSGPSAEMVASATDPAANYPVSTMVELCYPGSDNGAGGTAGCTSGSQPVGYIPAQSSSTTGFSPNPSVTVDVVAAYTVGSGYAGLPAGFCNASNLQSSNSGAACYMPASGVIYITDQSEYESVSYTYNSTTQTITLANLRFPHNNGMVGATGGLAGYAVSSNADTYTGGGTFGYEGQVFPIAGSVSATKIYYDTQTPNAVLGVSNDQGGGNANGGMCFSTTASTFALQADNHTVNTSWVAPSGNTNPEVYNGLAVTINTANATYNGTYAVTQFNSSSSYSFSYYLPTTPTGTAPTTGTVSFCNTSYSIWPAARVLNAYNPATSQVDGTLTVMANDMPWVNGDPIFEADYANVETSAQGGANSLTQFTPRNYAGIALQGYTTQGLVSGAGTTLFGITNGTPQSEYLRYGGTHVPPSFGYQLGGEVGSDLNVGQAPDSAVVLVSNCKGAPIGCSSVNSNFDVLLMPSVPNSVAGQNSISALNWDPNYQSAVRSQGLYGPKWTFGPNNDGASFDTLEAGYGIFDEQVSSPSISGNTFQTTQLTAIQNAPSVVGTPGSTSYQYYIVGHTLHGVTLPVTVGLITTGNATLNGTNHNLICAFHNSGYTSYDVLKGNTSTLLGSVSATTPNGSTYGTVANYSCVPDTGQSTSAYVAPTVNTTGDGLFDGLLTARLGVNLSGSNSPLELNGSAGTSGQCSISAGPGATPTWGSCAAAALPTATAAGQGIYATGAGTTYQAINISRLPVEFAGATPYSSEAAAEAGPDDTANFQTAVTDAAAIAGVATCQAGKWYHVVGPVNFSSNSGLEGTSNQTYGGLCFLVSTSATTSVLSAVGTSSAYLSGITIKNIAIDRSVAGTGTSAGIYASFTGGMIVSNTMSNDSIYDYYRHASPGYGTGHWSYNQAGWLLAESSGTYYGFYDDSADGYSESSIVSNHNAVACQNLGSGTTSYGEMLNGSAINDNDTWDFNTAGCSYHQVANYTGGGGALATNDIHWRMGTADNCLISCYKVTGLTLATDGFLEIDGGHVNSSVSSSPLIDIESSYGVNVRGVNINQHGGFGAQDALYAATDDHLVFANNTVTNFGTTNAGDPPIALNGVTHSSLTGNTVVANSTNAGNIINIYGNSTYNAITGNTLSGTSTAGYGIGIAAGSNYNNCCSDNSIDTTNIPGGAVGYGGTGNGSLPVVAAVNSLAAGGGMITGITSNLSTPQNNYAFKGIGPIVLGGQNLATGATSYFSWGFGLSTGTPGTNIVLGCYSSAWNACLTFNPSTQAATFGGAVTAPTLTATTSVTTPQLIGTVDTLSGATPAINAAHRDFTITLSANATPTVSGLAAGEDINAQICQPATGGPYTWTWPTAFHGGVTIGTTASTCSMQTFHSFNGTTAVAMSTGVINIAP